jgi:hypothetical protein
MHLRFVLNRSKESSGFLDAFSRALLDEGPTPERCLEAYHLQRTRFELIAERKVRRRQLTDDGNVEIAGRDLRQSDFRASSELNSAA